MSGVAARRKLPQTREDTPYERAATRFAQASNELPIVETLAARLVRDARREYNEAAAELRKFPVPPKP